MPQRRFLIASAFARLIRKEQGVVGRIVEGYFPARPHREHFVSLEPSQCYLVLAPAREGSSAQERAAIPRSHAEALLVVCVGQVGFECIIVPLGASQHALLQRFIAPGSLDLLTVEFEDRENASAFVPPAWFGPEVTQDAAYDRGALARAGVPAPEAIPVSNAMLEELLGRLEEASLAAQLGRLSPRRVLEEHLADEPAKGACSEVDEHSVSAAKHAQREALMAGLAEALQGFHPAKSASDTKAPVALPQARVEARRWG
jgi:CYTH domain-containing protein